MGKDKQRSIRETLLGVSDKLRTSSPLKFSRNTADRLTSIMPTLFHGTTPNDARIVMYGTRSPATADRGIVIALGLDVVGEQVESFLLVVCHDIYRNSSSSRDRAAASGERGIVRANDTNPE